MLLADTMAIFLSILGLLIAFPGLWLLCRSLWPGMVEEVKVECKRGLLIPFLTGIPITAAAFFGVAASGGGKHGSAGDITALVILSLFFIYANSGISGLASHIGERLPSPADAERPWRATIRGGIVLELTFLFPFVGWFIIWPVALTVGCGAVTRSFFARRRKASAVVAAVGAAQAQSDRDQGQAPAPGISHENQSA